MFTKGDKVRNSITGKEGVFTEYNHLRGSFVLARVEWDDGDITGIATATIEKVLPKLKVTLQTIRRVDVDDLDRWLEMLYNLPRGSVSLEADNEWGNGEEHTIRIGKGDHWWDKKACAYQEWVASRIIDNNFYGDPDIPSAMFLLDYAAEMGYIASGEYLVKVSW